MSEEQREAGERRAKRIGYLLWAFAHRHSLSLREACAQPGLKYSQVQNWKQRLCVPSEMAAELAVETIKQRW